MGFITQPELHAAFPAHSVYSRCTFNLGPLTITNNHTDPGNKSSIPCAITTLDFFDPDEGGYLYLKDLNLIIQFSPGSTILRILHIHSPLESPDSGGEEYFSIT